MKTANRTVVLIQEKKADSPVLSGLLNNSHTAFFASCWETN
jgi:hypothetical protein